MSLTPVIRNEARSDQTPAFSHSLKVMKQKLDEAVFSAEEDFKNAARLAWPRFLDKDTARQIQMTRRAASVNSAQKGWD